MEEVRANGPRLFAFHEVNDLMAPPTTNTSSCRRPSALMWEIKTLRGNATLENRSEDEIWFGGSDALRREEALLFHINRPSPNDIADRADGAVGPNLGWPGRVGKW